MMKFYGKSLLVFGGILASTPACSTIYDFGAYTEIADNASYGVGDTINVDGAATIVNHGTIAGALDISSGSDVYIENSGNFNLSAFSMGAGSKITQVITNSDEITHLSGIVGGYYVLIRDTSDILNWNDITYNTPGASGYTLSSAKIYMDNIVAVNDVKLEYTTLVYTDTMPDSDVAVFTNTFGDGVVRVIYNGIDPLYSVETYRVGSNIVAHLVRSNDYAQVTGGNKGDFLNLLRQKSPNDKLLKRLDSANTIRSFNHVMSKSIKLHPIKLMQPIKTMYSHKILEIMHIDQDDGFGIMPISVFSDSLFALGVEPNVNIKILDDLRVKISANISSLKYADNINEYTGTSYGLGLDTIYDLADENFVRAYGGFNFSMFDTGLVFDGHNDTRNPNGFSGYIAAEAGHKFNVDDSTYVSPFGMIGTDYLNVLESDKYDFYAGIGLDTGTSFDIDGVRYAYGLRGLVRTDMSVGGDINLSVLSITDAAGADFKFGVLYDESGMSYHMSLNAKFHF